MDPKALRLLKRRRRRVLGYLSNAEKRVERRKRELAGLNAVIARWDNRFDPAKTPSPHLKARPQKAPCGTVTHNLVRIIRAAGGTISVAEAVRRLKLPGGCRTIPSIRVRSALCYLVETGRAEKIGKGRLARWTIPTT